MTIIGSDSHEFSNTVNNSIINTTCPEQMVYSAIETTCFGLYWPSSGFYNIEEESINAVKTVFTAFIDSSSIF